MKFELAYRNNQPSYHGRIYDFEKLFKDVNNIPLVKYYESGEDILMDRSVGLNKRDIIGYCSAVIEGDKLIIDTDIFDKEFLDFLFIFDISKIKLIPNGIGKVDKDNRVYDYRLICFGVKLPDEPIKIPLTEEVLNYIKEKSVELSVDEKSIQEILSFGYNIGYDDGFDER